MNEWTATPARPLVDWPIFVKNASDDLLTKTLPAAHRRCLVRRTATVPASRGMGRELSQSRCFKDSTVFPAGMTTKFVEPGRTNGRYRRVGPCGFWSRNGFPTNKNRNKLDILAGKAAGITACLFISLEEGKDQADCVVTNYRAVLEDLGEK